MTATVTVAPKPRATDRPTSTVTLAPSPEPTVQTPANDGLAAGWSLKSNDLLTIAIPPGWSAVELSSEDAQSAFEALKQKDDRLAGIIGGPEALQDAAFWAFGPEPGQEAEGAGFVDNLNIRRTPLGAQRVTDLQPVLDVLLPQYERMGLEVTSTDTTRRFAGHSAALVTYVLQMGEPDGETFEVRGRQFLIATDSDLWILSLSTTPEREAEVEAELETMANSFLTK
jgi:hypothetical protein